VAIPTSTRRPGPRSRARRVSHSARPTPPLTTPPAPSSIWKLPSGFSFGVGGYHYHQVTGDSGSGAVLGPFIGRVTAVGPVIGYVLKAGALPINLNARWFAEFETENRMKGNAVFASLTVPLRVFAPPTPPKITK
jgi:Putative MetA-pathway of phenol degradation